MFSTLIRLIGGAALLLQLGGALAADTIKIAYINSMSGTFAFQGEEQLKVFNAAADMINAQGGALGGRRFEIVSFDDKANPQEALVVLKQVTDQDIRYVASTISSVAHALSDAVAKYNERNPDRPILFVNFNALDPALTEGKCNFWHFRFEAHTDMQLNALTDSMAKERSMQKVYLLNQDYAYGQAFARSAREMLAAKRPDVQIVGDDLIPLGKVKDFSPYVAKIRASGADSVLTGNWGNDLSLLIKASNEASLKATYYTLLAAFFGTPAAIGASGADRVKSTYSWNINAADEAWEKRVLQYEAALQVGLGHGLLASVSRPGDVGRRHEQGRHNRRAQGGLRPRGDAVQRSHRRFLDARRRSPDDGSGLRADLCQGGTARGEARCGGDRLRVEGGWPDRGKEQCAPREMSDAAAADVSRARVQETLDAQ